MPKVYNKRGKFPVDAVYVGRPTKWGNPFTHISARNTLAKYIVKSRDATIDAYINYLNETDEGQVIVGAARQELRGCDLVCWCSPLPCHADILLKIANDPFYKPS